MNGGLDRVQAETAVSEATGVRQRLEGVSVSPPTRTTTIPVTLSKSATAAVVPTSNATFSRREAVPRHSFASTFPRDRRNPTTPVALSTSTAQRHEGTDTTAGGTASRCAADTLVDEGYWVRVRKLICYAAVSGNVESPATTFRSATPSGARGSLERAIREATRKAAVGAEKSL